MHQPLTPLLSVGRSSAPTLHPQMCGLRKPSWWLQALGLAVPWVAQSPCQWSQYLEEVSGSAPQDLQDSNDELQAAVEGLRAQLPQSWRGQPHAQPNGRLLSRHGRAGRSRVLGGGSDMLLLGMVGAMGCYLPLLHRQPLVPGSTVLGRPASQHVRPSPASRWSCAPPTAACGRRASNPRLEVDTTLRAQREVKKGEGFTI